MTQAKLSPQDRGSSSFDRKVQYVIVYDPSAHALSTEPLTDLERMYPLLLEQFKAYTYSRELPSSFALLAKSGRHLPR